MDKVDPKSGKTYKDRVGLIVLLKHCSGRQLVFVSTHLARNPEDPKQTKSRAKQTAQLLKGLTDFATEHNALDAPALLAGDLNTTNIRQIADIARTVFEMCEKACHPFIFTATPPRTLPTSVTTSRRMVIDYFFMQSSLTVVDQVNLPNLTMDDPIPNANHPSDHVPIVFTLGFKANATNLSSVAKAWVQVLLETTEMASPLPKKDIERAFNFFDYDGDHMLAPVDFETGLKDLGLHSSLPALLEKLKTLLGREVASDGDGRCSQSEFSTCYLNAFLSQKKMFSESMRDAFAYFDSSGDGYLEFDELYTSFVDACPFDVSKEAFEGIFKKLDSNGDGHVTVDEFVDFLLKSQLS